MNSFPLTGHNEHTSMRVCFLIFKTLQFTGLSDKDLVEEHCFRNSWARSQIFVSFTSFKQECSHSCTYTVVVLLLATGCCSDSTLLTFFCRLQCQFLGKWQCQDKWEIMAKHLQNTGSKKYFQSELKEFESFWPT